MKIGMHDDKTKFPNLALMKLSAWHKKAGDEVEFFAPLTTFDKIYSSKVFTFTPDAQADGRRRNYGGRHCESWAIRNAAAMTHNVEVRGSP